MYDGNGYPYGLKGEEIPLEARVLAIASTFDVIYSRDEESSEAGFTNALNELKKGSGTRFDPYLVERFVSIYEKESVKAGGDK